MNFLYPAFLIGALAVAIPVILHLRRRDVAPEVPFTAVRLLRRSPIDRSKRRRLRDLLLLAARVGAVLLLAAAFARPFSPRAAVATTRVIAIDRSFSMGPAERFARARDLARAAVDEARGGEAVAVLAFDDRADIVAGAGTAADARAALDRVEPGFGATRYASIIEKAIEATEGTNGHLIVITDQQRSGWEDVSPKTLPAGWRVEVRDIGVAPANAAVVSVAVEADRVIASIRNTGSTRRESQVRVSVDGRQVGAGAFGVDAGDAVDQPVALQVPAAGVLTVNIDDPGGLPADDTRHVILGSAAAAKVLVVTSAAISRQAGFYLARALDASGALDGGFDAIVAPGTALSRAPEDLRNEYAAVVLLSTRALDRRAREALVSYLRAGGGLLLAASPELETSVLSTILEWNPPLSPVEHSGGALALAATDLRHPILRPFGALAANLGQVRFDRVWRVRPEGWQVVARFSDGTPALLERQEGMGRVLLFASDVDRRWNDFPLHPSFVPFVIESLRYAAHDRRRQQEFTVAAAHEGAARRPGAYTIGPAGQTIAVNVDPRESSPERLSGDEFLAMVQPAPDVARPAAELQASQTEARQSYWRFALLVMLAALVAESFAGRPS